MNRGFAIVMVISLLFFAFISKKTVDEKQDEYVCLPCGEDCDKVIHKGPGTCSDCNMTLVKKATITHNSIEPGDLCSFVAKAGTGNVLLLDVRTATEFEGKASEKFGKLNNAVNIPIQELERRLIELGDWKNKQIIVYCSHSHRSPRASYLLSQNGFTNVTNMNGGMSVWKESVKDKNCNQRLYISQ
jgi:rhodanese-related sulfurtransferase